MRSPRKLFSEELFGALPRLVLFTAGLRLGCSTPEAMATAADSTSNSPSRASAGSRRKSLPPGILQGQPPDSQFGACVAAAGDVNRDGYADVFVSAPGYDPDRGEALVFLGSTNGFKNRPDWTTEGGQAGEHFGSCAAGLGDINGDGFGDLIIGSTLSRDESRGRGRVCVYLGSAAGLSAKPNWMFAGQQAGETLGAWVASASDVNGDGYRDVIVCSMPIRLVDKVVFHGAPSIARPLKMASGHAERCSAFPYLASNRIGTVCSTVEKDPPTSPGRVLVFYGSAEGLRQQPDWEMPGEMASEGYLGAAASAGDVNGDGFDDLIVSAPLFGDRFKREGKVWV